MPALNIRDIGAERKAALEAEAKRRGQTTSDIVRAFIDKGLSEAERKRAQAEWIEASRAGRDAERAYVEEYGPTLAEYRRLGQAET